jgi:glycosyltransferase involved in cell wall biosynthesis
MPDFRNENTLNKILDKSSILPIGCELKISGTLNTKTPIILWNHRWEYDKNPDMFFKILFELKDKGINFSLIVVGEKYKDYPEIFNKAKKKLKNNILHFGYCESYKEYLDLIKKSNILPVTSFQDFFGISIVEAVSYGNYPILPDRLSYPELFDYNNNSDLFYKDETELKNKLINVINNIENIKDKLNNLSGYMFEKYSWTTMSKKYDLDFIELASN